MRYKRIGYNINVIRQSARLVINPITVDSFASLFNCTPVGSAPDSMMGPTKSLCIYLSWLGLDLVLSVIRGITGSFSLLRYFSDIVSHPGVLRVSQN